MIKNLKIPLVVVFGLMILIAGCSKNQQEPEKSVIRLNSLSMHVNGQFWEPSIIGGDSCTSRFSCEFFTVDQIPVYKIQAFRNSLSGANSTGDNTFLLQIMNVEGKGVYTINDAYGDFVSYARFINYGDDGHRIIYDTRKNNTNSKVTIDEMLPEKGLSLVGIKGSFTGTLYSIENPNDSMVIADSKFIFNRINRGDFLQCR